MPLPNAPPLLACCNFVAPVTRLREFALDWGFQGIDWTVTLDDLALGAAAEMELSRTITRLHPLEVRFHLAFQGVDLGAENPAEAQRAKRLFRDTCRLLSKVGGRVVTIHVGGLGRESSADLSWPAAVKALQDLVHFARRLRLRLCVENLTWGWSSRPWLYEKLLRLSGAWATLDVGHAQVCQAVHSGGFTVADFALPHPERVLNAHIYHEETEAGHVPPREVGQMEARLRLLTSLPLCRFWVLELREETALRQTLEVVRQYLKERAGTAAMAKNYKIQGVML